MPVKSKVEISQHFVAFSEYMNFNFPNKYTVIEGDAPVKKTAANVNETQAEADFLAYPEG